MCSITSKKQFETQQKELGRTPKEIKKNIEGIIKGQQNAYHIINNYKSEDFEQEKGSFCSSYSEATKIWNESVMMYDPKRGYIYYEWKEKRRKKSI